MALVKLIGQFHIPAAIPLVSVGWEAVQAKQPVLMLWQNEKSPFPNCPTQSLVTILCGHFDIILSPPHVSSKCLLFYHTSYASSTL